ncbi:MAG: hypothetical protein ABIM88_05665 [candidate division WOR-3 bacterium]
MAIKRTREPLALIRGLKEGRIVFFGPQWGAIIVDVKEGEPVSVRSTWGDGPKELGRLLSWREVRYMIRPAGPGSAPKESPPGGPDPEFLPDDPAIPPGYLVLLRNIFSHKLEEHGEEEWMSLEFVFERIAESNRALMVELSAQEVFSGLIFSFAGQMRGAIALYPDSVLYNKKAIKSIKAENLIMPLGVSISAPSIPDEDAALSFLPFSNNPIIRGKGDALADFLLRKTNRLILAGNKGYILGTMIWDMLSSNIISEEDLILALYGENEVLVFQRD